MKNRISQAGNSLFLILTCVGLFGALMYAVAQSGRISGKSLSEEKAIMAASQLMRFAGQVEKGVERVRLVNGCKENELDFHNEIYRNLDDTLIYAPNHNPGAPTDGRCSIFHPNGGQVIPLIIDDLRVDNQAGAGGISGHGSTQVMPILGVGSNNNELVLSFFQIRAEICQAIHRKLGLPEELEEDSHTWGHYNGDLDAVVSPVGDEFTEITGARSLCVRNNLNANAGNFYHVLIAR